MTNSRPRGNQMEKTDTVRCLGIPCGQQALAEPARAARFRASAPTWSRRWSHPVDESTEGADAIPAHHGSEPASRTELALPITPRGVHIYAGACARASLARVALLATRGRCCVPPGCRAGTSRDRGCDFARHPVS